MVRSNFHQLWDVAATMWLMLQQGKPDDYVLGTGQSHSVKEFLEEAFAYQGLDWEQYVKIDPRYFRPTDVELLLADPTKARDKLGWEPKVTFKELVRIMVDADMEAIGLKVSGEGKAILAKHGLNTVDKALLSGSPRDER